ncbi:MAG TPA: phage tail protein [bacterium]|nr:phage tail protein [bacterium]
MAVTAAGAVIGGVLAADSALSGWALFMAVAQGALTGAAIASNFDPYFKPKTPSLPQNDNIDNSPTYGFDGIQNVETAGHPIPIIYGRMKTGGTVIALNNFSDENSDSKLQMILALCEGEIASIENIKINNNDVTKYEDVNIETRLGLLNQEEIDFGIAYTNYIKTLGKKIYRNENFFHQILKVETDIIDLTIKFVDDPRNLSLYSSNGGANFKFGDSKFNISIGKFLGSPSPEGVTPFRSVWNKDYTEEVERRPPQIIPKSKKIRINKEETGLDSLEGYIVKITNISTQSQVYTTTDGDYWGWVTTPYTNILEIEEIDFITIGLSEIHNLEILSFPLLEKDSKCFYSVQDTDTNKLMFNFMIQGLYQTNASNGAINANTVNIKIRVLKNSEEKYATAISYTDRTQSTIRKTFTFDATAETNYTFADCDIEIIRLNEVDDFYTHASLYVFSIDEIEAGKLSYPQTALLGLSAISNEQLNGQMPEVTSIITGIKTNHLSGEHNYRCPANAIYDLLTNEIYGYGENIDINIIDKDSFEYARSYCYNHTPQLNCDIVIDTISEFANIANDICQCFDGLATTENGMFKLLVRERADSVMHINSNLIIANSFQTLQKAESEIVNTIELQFLNAEKDYERDTVILRDKDSLDKPEVRKTLTLKAVTNRAQALWIGSRMLKYEKYSRKRCEFQAGLGIIECHIGDVVSITHSRHGITNKKYRVMLMTLTEDQKFQRVYCEEYTDAIYSDDTIEYIIEPEYYSSLPDYKSAVANPNNLRLSERIQKLSDGTIENTIDAYFDKPADNRYSYAKIYISEDSQTWQYRGLTYGNSYTIMGALDSLKIYKITAVAVDRNGKETAIDSANISQIYLIGKMQPPADVSEFAGIQKNDKIILTWKHIDDIDLSGYEIRKDTGSGWGGGDVIISNFAGNRFEFDAEASGTQRYWIKAVDTSGNYSVNAKSVSLNIAGVSEKKRYIFEYDEIDEHSGDFENCHYIPAVNDIPEKFINAAGIRPSDLPNDTPTVSSAIPALNIITNQNTIFSYTTPVCDLTKIDSVNISEILNFKAFRSDAEITFESYPNRSFSDYPENDFDFITPDFEIKRFIKLSNDNEEWSDWTAFKSGAYYARYFQMKIEIEVDLFVSRFEIFELKYKFDVPERSLFIRNLAVAAATGSDVEFENYNTAFYTDELEIIPVVINANTQVMPVISSITKEGFHIELLDASNNKVSGNVNLTVRGW